MSTKIKARKFSCDLKQKIDLQNLIHVQHYSVNSDKLQVMTYLSLCDVTYNQNIRI